MPGLLDSGAIGEMMRTLMQPPQVQQTPQGGLLGGPMPAVMSSQMPQVTPPPMAHPRLSMADRIHERMSGLLDSVKSSAPAGYDGLLSQSEMQSAQPGRGESIIGRVLGLGTDVFNKQQYGRNLDGILKMKEYAAKVAEGRDSKALEKKHAALREQVGALLGDTTMLPADRFAAATKLFGVAYANGDERSLGSIANLLQTIKPETTKPKEYEPQAFSVGGNIVWVKPGDPIPAGAKPYHAPSNAGPQLIAVQEPDGQGGFHTVLRPKVEGQELPGPNTRTPATIQKALAANSTQLQMIHKAIEAVKAHPKAFGITRGAGYGIGARLDPRVDPEGNDARGLVSNVGSLKVHDRSGAAVSVSEFSRLAPFVPNLFDPSDKVLNNLQRMADELEIETNALRTGAGTGPSPKITPKGSGSATGKTGLDAYRHLLK